ncbi:MAG: molybdopterin converting factor subunit 1 [Alphaproteobacteria bacterium]|nr:MAG: molybdopterin converting factor subunit 1 [Alphaproteobacteria bacterium]
MNLLYFAHVRENIGCSSEQMSLPDNISNVGELMSHLRAKGKGYQSAFENEDNIRVAVNQLYVNFDHVISEQDEIAFFPPMTGG